MQSLKGRKENTEEINLEILKRWLQGDGLQPGTWRTLIQVLWLSTEHTCWTHPRYYITCYLCSWLEGPVSVDNTLLVAAKIGIQHYMLSKYYTLLCWISGFITTKECDIPQGRKLHEWNIAFRFITTLGMQYSPQQNAWELDSHLQIPYPTVVHPTPLKAYYSCC